MTEDYFKSPLDCSADLPKCVSGMQRKYHEPSDLCFVLTNRHHLTGLSPLDCIDLQFFSFLNGLSIPSYGVFLFLPKL